MMLAQMNLREQNLVKPELVTIANDSERWEASKQQTGDANTNSPGTDRMAFFNFRYANESNGLILALEKYQASERKTSFPRISTYPSCCAQETKNERVDVGDRYRRGSKQQVQVQKESAANDCTSYPGTVSNNDAEQGPQSLAAHTGSNKCLICRNVDCRGNLYCNMLSPNNNDNELIALNRRKSVVQNRRKSALQMQSGGSAATTLGDESANSGGDGDKSSSILQALYSKSNSPTRRSREDDFQHRCMYSSLEHNNDTNCPDAREKCSCELKSCAQDRTRTNYCNLNINSNFTPARLTTYRFQPKKLVPFMPLTARESKDKESRTCQQYRYCLDGDTSSFRDGVSSSVRELESEPSDASQIGSVSKKSSLPSSPSSFRTTSRRPKSIFRYRPRSSLSSSAPFSLINAILWVIVCTMLMNFTISLVVSGANSNSTSPASGVCTSIDIRNRAQALNNLTGCRVIEGFLVITLMDAANQTDFENYTFPHLTEITEYLMLYRVSGIRSLAKLFPNLQVIRGNYLFEGFALIIFENANMEEIGLTSLTTIMRGGVRIEKNPILCFVHTIHWNRIALNATPETLVFKHNKATNECPLCGPGKVKGAGSTYHLPDNKQYCWNQDHYQKICPSECGHRACNSQGKCCNETCLGDCPNDENVCSLCRNLVAYGGKYGEKRCVQECPANSYKHMNRRCLTKEECLRVVKPLRVDTETYPYVPFEGECLLGCKSGYEKVNRTCVPCHNKCTKQCGPKRIFSIRDAEDLRGCTIITGDLMISIRQAGPHLVEDLESALSSIEEIQGYLKITRTYSIVSLSFFRRLRVIRGLTLDESKYALYVLDNQNLQNLWAENQNVTIERGRIFFHFNPKLCYNKIEALKPFISGNKTFDLAEVAPDSNGDRVACDIQELKIKSIETSEQAALVTVVPMGFEDERVFLGYQYYYIEAPHKNVSIYENRHGCGYDSWDVDDDHNKDSVHLFTHLKPYTQYALYVKTYTIASEKKGGQSKIHYFRTLPSTPDPVRNLEYTVLNYSSIEIRWIEPREPKGNLTEYRFQAEITAENPMILEQRNYCKEPIKETIRERIPDEPPKKPVIASEESCRSICKGTEHTLPSKTIEESPVRENEIDFEDAIQNFVYVRRTTPSEQKGEDQARSKRSIETNPVKTLPNTNNETDVPHEEELRMIKDEHGSWSQYGKNVTANVKSFIFTGLKHYSRYKIYVKACREGTGARCSMEARIYPRTAKKDGADDVQNLTAHIENINNTRNSVRLTWKEPPVPNGLVVSYSIKYYRVDMEHAKHVDKCITYREYNSTKGYILYDMDSGNYSVQVMATSLAGDGTYCKPVFFYIKESRLSWQMITLICVLILTFIIIIGILIWYFRRRCLPPPDDLKLFTSVNPEYISMQYTPDEWEIPREKIIQLRELGQGSFGMVYEGIVENLRNDGVDVSCAIKTVNENATDRERINFLNEASVMKAFDTFHVVRLYGVVSRDQPTLVIMELMTNGDLKGYLRSNRPDAEAAKAGKVTGTPPTLKRILQMAIEIADGMAYLSAKKFVHRDLAARNCMVAEDLTVKIGDFGMTRDIYETDYYRKGTKGLLPVRWMSPESLKDGVFSSSSDVFSYGVVLWEMATLASQPYQGLSNDQVLRYVIDGGVMERPENCPDKLYNLMRRCWQHRPSSRPTFMEIINHLLDDANTNFRTVSFFHTDHGQEIFKQLLAGKRFTDHIDDTTPLRMGDDDFKLDVGENFLMDRTDSHLVPEEPQHSPYSLGSALAINSIPDGTSKRNNDNSSPSSVITSNKKDKDSASTTTATTVQSFSNSLVPPRFRRMWRNAFLGNGNSNYSNRSCNGAGAGGSDTAATVGVTTTTTTPSVAEAGTSVPVGIEIGAKASVAGSNSGANSGSGISSGISGLLSGLRGRDKNSDGRGGSNSRSTGKDFSSKSGQKVSQETITNPLLSDTSFDEISAIQSTTLNIQPDPHILQSSQNDNKVKNSSLENRNRSTNQIGSSASSPYQKPERQTAQHNQSEEQWMYSNGFVPSSNSSTPLLPQTSSSQLYRDGARPPPKVLDTKRYPGVTSVKEPVTARTSQPRLNKNYSQKANYAEQRPEGRNSIARRRSPTSTSS